MSENPDKSGHPRGNDVLADAVNRAGVVVFQTDRDGSLTFLNAAWEDVTGFDIDACLGRSFADFVVAEPRDGETALLAPLLRGDQQSCRIESKIRTKDDSFGWFDVNLQTTTDEYGNITGISGTLVDITERKTYEKELEESITRLELALEGTNTGVWEWNPETDAITWQDPTIEIFGYEPSEFTGTYQEFADRVHPDDLPKVEEKAQRAIEENEMYTDSYRIETPDGDVRWIESRAKVLEENGGQPRLVGIEMDVTEQRKTKTELRKKNERLEEFAGIVSHDLRNPLTIATGTLELAREDSDSPHLDTVSQALDRMQAIIEDTHTLARQGKRIDEKQWIDVPDLLDHCWEMVDTVDAVLDIQDEFAVRGSRGQLEHVFENLFRNAVEHGGEDVTVRVGFIERRGFYVEDSGRGFPEDTSDELFDPGTTTSDQGTGFGLAIVKRVVEAHGWQIRTAVGDTDGARFEITGVDVDTSETSHSR